MTLIQGSVATKKNDKQCLEQFCTKLEYIRAVVALEIAKEMTCSLQTSPTVPNDNRNQPITPSGSNTGENIVVRSSNVLLGSGAPFSLSFIQITWFENLDDSTRLEATSDDIHYVMMYVLIYSSWINPGSQLLPDERVPKLRDLSMFAIWPIWSDWRKVILLMGAVMQIFGKASYLTGSWTTRSFPSKCCMVSPADWLLGRHQGPSDTKRLSTQNAKNEKGAHPPFQQVWDWCCSSSSFSYYVN